MLHRIIQQDLEQILASPLEWDRLAGKSILVTGANGFFPSCMVDVLLALNANRGLDIHVVALVRNAEKGRRRFAAWGDAWGLRLLVQDVCEPVSLPRKPDIIVHAASQASPKYFRLDPVGTLLPNTIGTANLLHLAQRHGVENFLFFSSAEIYGDTSQVDQPIGESFRGVVDQTNVRSCYAESKRMGEAMCTSWHQQFGVPAKIVRPFHTYGPGLSLDDGRVFADIIASLVGNRDIELTGDGTAVRAYCYLADAVSACFHVLLHGENGHAYNVGDEGQAVSVADLAARVVAAFPEKAIGIRRAAPRSEYYASPVSCIVPDTQKLRRLGWTPTISIEEGFRRAVLSYA